MVWWGKQRGHYGGLVIIALVEGWNQAGGKGLLMGGNEGNY